MARSIDTGSPIWMADANVVLALTGSNLSHPSLYARYSGLAFYACATTMRGMLSTRPRSLAILKPL